MLRELTLGLFGLALLSSAATATCSITNTLTNGTTADATKVMQNFTDLATCTAPVAGPSFTGAVGIQSGQALNWNGVHTAITMTSGGDSYIDSDGTIFLRSNGASSFFTVAGANSTGFFPNADNAIPSGKSGNRWTAVYAVNGTIQTSDAREKHDITALTIDGLKLINDIRPVSFKWNDVRDHSMEGEQLGFIAQEVEKVLPQLVVTGRDKEGLKSLKYNEFIPVLTRALQQQQVEIQLLKAANDNRAAEITQLRTALGSVQRKLDIRVVAR